MTGEGIKKKRDPIFSVCFVVFVVACVGVLGVYVDEHYIQQDDTKVAYGDKVVTNYTGTYYAYYGENNAVVFDTSYASIGNDDDIAKAYSFSKTSYSEFTVTVGSGSALKMFEESLVGHKVGDKFKIMIPAGEGYISSEGSVYTNQNTTGDVDLIDTMSYTQFKDLYDDELTAGISKTITTAYGWTGVATLSNTDNMVTIVNHPEADQTYEYIGNDDSEYGKISFKVNSVGSDKIGITMILEDTTAVDGGIQMVKLNLTGQDMYITAYNGATFDYKTCPENCFIDLYFEIEIVSINA